MTQFLSKRKKTCYIMLSFSLMFLRGKRKKLFLRSCLLKNSRVSVADLLASLVFHLPSRQCDPAMKPRTVLVYHHSQTATLSQDLLEVFPLFLIKVHTFIMVKADNCRHSSAHSSLLHSSALHPPPPLHNPRRNSRV